MDGKLHLNILNFTFKMYSTVWRTLSVIEIAMYDRPLAEPDTD